MKKISFSLLAALMLFNFASCKKDEAPKTDEPKAEVETEAPKADGKMDCSAMTAEVIAKKVADPKAITKDEYAAVLETMQCCKIDEKSFAVDKNSCETNKALDKLKKDGAKLPSLDSVAAQLVNNDSPIVRAKAYESFSGLFGANKQDLTIAKDAIKNEKDPFALQALVSGLSNAGNKDADVAKFLLDMAKHENSFVRRKAAIALGNSWSDKVEGAADAVIALMADSDENVAKLACAGAGKLNDEKVIEPIVKILNDESKEKLHGECVRGLAAMWLDYPSHKNHTENAYKATMDYLKKTPRTNKVPAWNAIASFNTVAAKEIDRWKSEATWFKMDEFSAVMTDLIKDDNFNWLGKSPAMKAIAAFGGKAELEKIKPVVDGLSDQKVKDAYAKELEKAK